MHDKTRRLAPAPSRAGPWQRAAEGGGAAQPSLLTTCPRSPAPWRSTTDVDDLAVQELESGLRPHVLLVALGRGVVEPQHHLVTCGGHKKNTTLAAVGTPSPFPARGGGRAARGGPRAPPRGVERPPASPGAPRRPPGPGPRARSGGRGGTWTGSTPRPPPRGGRRRGTAAPSRGRPVDDPSRRPPRRSARPPFPRPARPGWRPRHTATRLTAGADSPLARPKRARGGTPAEPPAPRPLPAPPAAAPCRAAPAPGPCASSTASASASRHRPASSTGSSLRLRSLSAGRWW